MYKCNHCNIEIPDNQVEGRVVKVGPKDNPKYLCRECGEPVVYIPDMPQAAGAIHGAQATLISNSDNRITTNNYYGGGTPDEQIETPYGPCRRSEARLCKRCRQWVPLTYLDAERGICDNCITQEGIQAYEEGKTFFEMELYDEALNDFQKFESICNNPKELAALHYYIGRCFYEKKLWKEAFKYFVKSRKQIADSVYYIGRCLYDGLGVTKDQNKALAQFQIATEMGSRLAFVFIEDEKCRQIEEEKKRKEEEKRRQEEEKRRIQEEEMRKKEEVELNSLSVKELDKKGLYYSWLSSPLNYEKAIKYYHKAANLGDCEAMYALGRLYEEGGYGIQKDYREALKWYKSAASRGYVPGLEGLAKMYENGFGVPQDMYEATKYYKEAAEKNSNWGTAECNYARMLYYGLGTKQDYLKAMYWWKESAKHGNTEAYYHIGEMYYNGIGVHRDVSEAKKWFLNASYRSDYEWSPKAKEFLKKHY